MKKGNSMNGAMRNLFLWLIVAVLLIAIFSNYGPKKVEAKKGGKAT